MPFMITFEKRVEDIPKWLPAATSLGSVVVAFIVSGIILKIIGGQPLLVGKFFFNATFGSWAVFSDTLVKATPLILVGLACAVAFKMKLWNIGAEGQFCRGPSLLPPAACAETAFAQPVPPHGRGGRRRRCRQS